MSDFRCTRRAALVAIFAAGMHCAVAVLAVVMWSGLPPAPPTVSPVDDLELLADAEAQDFIDDGEDLEFYEWAAGETES